ncbi:uncharacterized protein LOC103184875 [Callorhinchus milii]|uniref:uncharacterized protein LOC103184875 n=1 Tax=Callorhinchus milii TaxID=7868 RepID=UPI0004575B22|nr:uncharacterized protein LOC103184875 [Callorhinchus milii]|eukprot:gi/632969821/ref/XP_007901296.1/ PREDICTED: uncharacterized protein LOC103184875 [Callorhinchus milii]
MKGSYLAEQALKNLIRMPTIGSDDDLKLGCSALVKQLIESSSGTVEDGVEGAIAPLSVDMLLKEADRLLIEDIVSGLNPMSASKAKLFISAVCTELFQDDKKNLGRILAFLSFVSIVAQRVIPDSSSPEDEVALLSDCVAQCLIQHKHAWIQQQPNIWGSFPMIATGMFLMSGALIGTILSK